jgi:hypothetical protein
MITLQGQFTEEDLFEAARFHQQPADWVRWVSYGLCAFFFLSCCH